MEPKTEVMVSLAAAIGANCIPCFDFIYGKAREVGLPESEVQAVIEAAFKVKNGANVFMKNAVNDTTGSMPPDQAPCCSALEGACNC